MFRHDQSGMDRGGVLPVKSGIYLGNRWWQWQHFACCCSRCGWNSDNYVMLTYVNNNNTDIIMLRYIHLNNDNTDTEY